MEICESNARYLILPFSRLLHLHLIAVFWVNSKAEDCGVGCNSQMAVKKKTQHFCYKLLPNNVKSNSWNLKWLHVPIPANRDYKGLMKIYNPSIRSTS